MTNPLFRTKIMSLRLTPAQWERVGKAAAQSGYRTHSEWVRNLVNLNLPDLFDKPEASQPPKPPFKSGRRTNPTRRRPGPSRSPAARRRKPAGRSKR